MKKLALLFALLTATPALASPSDMICNVGPTSKSYGDTSWLVYACNDGHSISIVSAPGSKALPFVFFFHWEGSTYQLSGVGTGDKAFTDAAFLELKALTGTDIEHLLAEAQAKAHHH